MGVLTAWRPKGGYARARPQLILNGGFEIAGAGGADVFASWIEVAGTSFIADTVISAEVHGGSHALKLTLGVGAAMVYQAFTVIPGSSYTLTFFCRGDGTVRGLYRIYDVTNALDIKASGAMGLVGVGYTAVSYVIIAPAGCTSVRVYFISPNAAGSAWVDDVSVVIV